ncbi:30S ribosomal protein S15 [Candidatus Woesearchaeota archaeon]|nr:30S ribosomal protein S15 [Candidatus Woesearchaeota archaeon]
MARKYSRKKGKAGSHKPERKTAPSWIRYKPKEIEMLIVKLAKKGKTSSQIGIFLRDSYGIPSVKEVTKKKIQKILKENKITSEIPEDLMALIKRSIAIRKHLEENHKDESAKRGLILTESKLKSLARYHKRAGNLAEEWKYHPERIRLYVE